MYTENYGNFIFCKITLIDTQYFLWYFYISNSSLQSSKVLKHSLFLLLRNPPTLFGKFNFSAANFIFRQLVLQRKSFWPEKEESNAKIENTYICSLEYIHKILTFKSTFEVQFPLCKPQKCLHEKDVKKCRIQLDFGRFFVSTHP